MTFPKHDHPLFCPQSGGPGSWRGCPRCGRRTASRESMGGNHDPRAPHTMLPHLRYRWQDWSIRTTAYEAGLRYIVEPHEHGGRAKHGRWQLVRLSMPAVKHGDVRPTVTGDVRQVFDTQAEAFWAMDIENGWLHDNELGDMALHLALWHGRWFDRAPGDDVFYVHDRLHDAMARATPHFHEGSTVRPLVPA